MRFRSHDCAQARGEIIAGLVADGGYPGSDRSPDGLNPRRGTTSAFYERLGKQPRRTTPSAAALPATASETLSPILGPRPGGQRHPDTPTPRRCTRNPALGGGSTLSGHRLPQPFVRTTPGPASLLLTCLGAMEALWTIWAEKGSRPPGQCRGGRIHHFHQFHLQGPAQNALHD
jgi:hypothetical protein